MDFDSALRALPHGPEFRFVNALASLEPGKSATGTYRLRGDEAFLNGHFPGQPLMPAVLMVEAIAQVAGVAAQSDTVIPPLADLRLTAIRSVKVFGAAFPGDELQIEAEVQGRMGGLIQATGRVRVGDKVLAEGQVTLSGGAASA
ncbi:3-hydroxyacyl-ACP dehydratase FabZ family protein [Verrucomicrobium sp. BvORR034]|uniref:3-hydroxyacyl-ACP dehydratase FabZ family protein n=1 Tax=Verrucomicrobium sp. BvORR034 TaxID=1396418 RepID=UPI000679273B|nr:3-hydroxyacyl-ACP dehydratase FabZ family protein [Verrucomicrobium sp. BvORR034]